MRLEFQSGTPPASEDAVATFRLRDPDLTLLRAAEVRITTAPLRKKPGVGTNLESQFVNQGEGAVRANDRGRHPMRFSCQVAW
jgi:hypothetical protein